MLLPSSFLSLIIPGTELFNLPVCFSSENHSHSPKTSHLQWQSLSDCCWNRALWYRLAPLTVFILCFVLFWLSEIFRMHLALNGDLQKFPLTHFMEKVGESSFALCRCLKSDINKKSLKKKLLYFINFLKAVCLCDTKLNCISCKYAEFCPSL